LLSTKGARRVARESAVQSFQKAADAINEDWDTGLDGKQIQRWAQALGQEVLEQRQTELEACEQGRPPAGPVNDPQLLVVGMDGGRVQGREKDPVSGSRWREDKVLTVTSYLPGDGKKKKPKPLVTTHVATMLDSKGFAKLARLEAERRGVRQAKKVLVLGDGAWWIDTIHEDEFARHVRIVDYYHACEHLNDVARVVFLADMVMQKKLAAKLTNLLWRGQIQCVIAELEELAKRAGPMQESDGPEHPRRVLWQNLGYFQKHREHMQYAAYRKRGWPIGSGTVESGVKQFNKRVKGTEQFWHNHGVEPILALRGLWLSQDGRWARHWRQEAQPEKKAA
jgi:hypothetical protein